MIFSAQNLIRIFMFDTNYFSSQSRHMVFFEIIVVALFAWVLAPSDSNEVTTDAFQ